MAWLNSTVGPRKYFKQQSSAAVAMAAAPIYSDVFDYDMSDAGYAWLGINISIAGSAATCPLKLQASYDGTNFSTIATIVADVTPAATGDKMYFVDLTSYRAPYMRLVLNDASAAIGTTGRFTFILVGKHKNNPFV